VPELPEVEVIARRMRKEIVGRSVTKVRVTGKTVKEPSRAKFIEALEGAKLVDVKRRAKHLLLETNRGVLLVHLRLTGDLNVVAQEPKFTRVAFDLDDGRTLAFSDGRHLGEMRFVDDATKHLADLGPEPLDDAFTVDKLQSVMSKRAIKAVLLDQEAIAGVGNIYADEACFRAKIHPATIASTLKTADVKKLHDAIRAALTASIAELEKESDIAWRYANRNAPSPFFVYDRAGEPCRRCKTKLATSKVAGRTTVFCPKCQPKPKPPRSPSR
jgi:formamidopyrimidine-DNA glycosylase